MLRIQAATFGVLLLAFIVSRCGSEPEEILDNKPKETFSASTDSVFGNLTEKQLYYQHLIIDLPASFQNDLDSVVDYILTNQPGAISLKNWSLDTTELLKSRLDTLPIIQPLFYTNIFNLLELKPTPFWQNNEAINHPYYSNYFTRSNHGLVDFSDLGETDYKSAYFDSLVLRDDLLVLAGAFSDKNIKKEIKTFTNRFENSKNSIILSISGYDTVNFEVLKKNYNNSGFLISNSEIFRTNNLLENGMDFIFVHSDVEQEFSAWNESKKSNEFIKSTKSILGLKEKLQAKNKRNNFKSELKFLRTNIQSLSSSVINNKGKLFPIKGKFKIYSEGKISIRKEIRLESNISTNTITFTPEKISKIIAEKGERVLLISDTLNEACVQELKKIEKEDKVLVCFSDVNQFKELENLPNLMYIPPFAELDYEILSQQINGKIAVSGDFMFRDSLYKGIKIKNQGLARTSPEFVGMSSDTLRQIDYAIRAAMNGRAFPGCQVLLAKNGSIIYDKCFGHHSYKKEKLVTPESMYDLASITKVVATTLVGMKLYESQSYELEDSLVDYLPDSLRLHLKYPSSIRNITFQELFIHKSGLPSGFPIIDYMQYTSKEIQRFDKYYCDYKDSVYTIEVAENFYLEDVYRDSMWLRLNRIFLDPAKPYKYSDVSMNTLYYMFSSIINKTPREFGFTQPLKKLKELNLFEEYLYTNFYKPLGMNQTRYKPLRFFNKNQIVPTEDEKYWRKQLLQGSVHDPNAALMGGIAGNAGMYSNTNDLVKLLQMLLNKGEFEGKRYLNAETVTKFTSAQPESHRGLGWNKPTLTSSGYGISDYATLQTFGHTGFTGTCIWVDPASEIVYIFLANRVHPDVNNRIYQFGIRKTIHQNAYRSLIYEEYSRN